jgi:hypothetical protein
VILVADPLLRTWIGWVAGINEIGTADSQKALHLLDRFGDHAVRLAGLKLVLQLNEGVIGDIGRRYEKRRRLCRRVLDGAAARARDLSTKYHREGMSVDNNAGSALQCVIRNIKDKKFFVGLGHASDVPVREHHENIPP